MIDRIPVWRAGLGVLVLVMLVAVLAALAPIYLDDYRLKGYVKRFTSSPGLHTQPDEQIRAAIVNEGKRLDLPVRDGDVTVSHPGGRVWVDVKYMVGVNFPMYNVDLHFHTSAQGN